MNTNTLQSLPRIAITMGDINGIGPEILAKALASGAVRSLCRPVIHGSLRILMNAAQFAPGLASVHCATSSGDSTPDNVLPVIESGHPIDSLNPGTVQADAGRAAVAWIRAAVADAIGGAVDAVVTCPINKEGINLAGSDAIGHTEIVAAMTNTPEYRMSLFSDRMRIVHISAHLPLTQALALVKTDRIAQSIRIAHDALLRLGLPRRRIAVAGLNPHAGEGGLLGDEELREIVPAINQCAHEGIDCSGPYPPDTVFRRMLLGDFDLVVAMYHDQGHIALKLVAMDEGVNVTLGIPIVRTSVDHGTAYDIAWKGVAREDSLIAAIRLAAKLSSTRSLGGA